MRIRRNFAGRTSLLTCASRKKKASRTMSRFITAPRPTRRVTPREGYRLWSRTYDSDLNPVLTLEQRILGELLPRVEKADVVDVGCGTGRWLERLAALKPRTLRGIDCSKEML